MTDPCCVAEVVADVSPPIRSDSDLQSLRRRCSELMDRVNLLVRQSGLDTDDCVVERFARMRFRGRSDCTEVPLESLTDVVRLVKPFIESSLRATSSGAEPPVVEITGLRFAAIRAPDAPPLHGHRT